MRHIKLLTQRGLTQQTHPGKHSVFAYCSSDSVDICYEVDEAHCQGVSTDFCVNTDTDNGACMFNSTDDCGVDRQACAFNTYDYCAHIDAGSPCINPGGQDYCDLDDNE